MNRKLNILFFFLTCVVTAQVPDTDLWLFDIARSKSGEYTITNARNITNRKGYDNQPFFNKAGDKLFYVSIGEDKQADVYYCKVGSKKSERLTSSTVSEYSPRLSDDEKSFFCVMVEQDSTQRVHRIDLEKGSDMYSSAFDSVGYCTFLNADTAVYYKLTQPHSLRYHVISTGEDNWLADNPVRSIIRINRHEVLFGVKTGSIVTLLKYDLFLRKAVKFAEDELSSENFMYHPLFGVLRSAQNKISRFDENSGKWVELFDLSSPGLKNVTRFTIDEKGKHLVVAENYPDK